MGKAQGEWKDWNRLHDSLAPPDLQPRKGGGRGIEVVRATRGTRSALAPLAQLATRSAGERNEWNR